jgi:hypothetical protein
MHCLKARQNLSRHGPKNNGVMDTMNGIKTGGRMLGIVGWLFLAGFVVEVTGCETAAQRLDPEPVDQIKLGITTRQEVLHDFGEPFETLSGGKRTLVLYRRGYLGSRGGFGPTEDSTLTVVSILFGADDRVLRKHYSFHKIRTYYGAGMVSVGNEISEKTIAKVRPEVTTRVEAEKLLGEPTAESLGLDGRLVVDWSYQDANFVGAESFKTFRIWFNGAGIATAVKTQDNRQVK